MAPPSPDDYARYAAAVGKTEEASHAESLCAHTIGLSYPSRSLMILNADVIRVALRRAVNPADYKTKEKVMKRAAYLYKRLLETLYPG